MQQKGLIITQKSDSPVKFKQSKIYDCNFKNSWHRYGKKMQFLGENRDKSRIVINCPFDRDLKKERGKHKVELTAQSKKKK